MYMVRILKAIFVFVARMAGLWKLKGSAGTLGDDIAAKLAVGELERDLDQERLELQAMNSERFRHRFLDKNRPWILQHLTELLTPRTLNMPGADGRPHIEYIRDVYTDLMHMGEGHGMPDDRSDISTDSGEDLLAKQRRNWPTGPVAPTYAEIMRMWLRKARARRKYLMLVQGIIQSHCDNKCHTCQRTEAGGFVMTVELATEGEEDNMAVDRLIAQYEAEVPRFDEVTWKAFVRKHGSYITRCNICMNLVEQARAKAKKMREPGRGRTTRAHDLSSDSEGEMEVMFDAVIVGRSSSVGRLMRKWLVAARRRMGGTFPRPQAADEMRQYSAAMKNRAARAERRRKKKERAGKKAELTKEEEDQALVRHLPKHLLLNAATTAIAQKWLRTTREVMIQKAHNTTKDIHGRLSEALDVIVPEDDWFFTADFRTRGEKLLEEGDDLLDSRGRLVAEQDSRIRRINREFESYKADKDTLLENEREALEKRLAHEKHEKKEALDIELLNMERQRRAKETEMRTELDIGDGELPEDKQAELRRMDAKRLAKRDAGMAEIEDSLIAQRDALTLKQAKRAMAIDERRVQTEARVQNVRVEFAQKMRQAESKWQKQSQAWLNRATARIAVKKKEDADQEERAQAKKGRRR